MFHSKRKNRDFLHFRLSTALLCTYGFTSFSHDCSKNSRVWEIENNFTSWSNQKLWLLHNVVENKNWCRSTAAVCKEREFGFFGWILTSEKQSSFRFLELILLLRGLWGHSVWSWSCVSHFHAVVLGSNCRQRQPAISRLRIIFLISYFLYEHWHVSFFIVLLWDLLLRYFFGLSSWSLPSASNPTMFETKKLLSDQSIQCNSHWLDTEYSLI